MENVKIPFFKRVKLAIFNFEKYADFALEKLSTAIKFYVKIILIFSIIISIAFTYKFSTIMNNEEELQILGNQLIETGVEREAIDQAITIIKDTDATQLYAILLLSMIFYLFIAYFLVVLMDVVLVSILGFIVSKMTRMKIKYKSIFAMSIYAFTLPIILNAIYSVVNLLTGFTISYFQIVYNVISYIYIVTAVLMIKTDFIEQQRELINVVKEQAKIRREERREKDNNEDKEKENNQNKKENDNEKEEPDNGQDPIQTP